MKPLLYVAGPLSAPTKNEVIDNITEAARHAFGLWAIGCAVICPHLNTAFSVMDMPWYTDLGYDVWLNGDLAIIERIDALYLLPNWASSRGASIEQAQALRCGKPIFMSIAEVEDWMLSRWPRAKSDLP